MRSRTMQEFVVLFHNLPAEKIKEYVKKVKDLGGKSSTSQQFHRNITHVVCGSLTDSEVFLDACVSGCWVLTADFIEESHRHDQWLEEVNYEFCMSSGESTELISTYKRWRWKIHTFNEFPFAGWSVAILLESKEKAAKLQKLLKYGKAEVQTIPVPAPNVRLPVDLFEATYVLMDESSKHLAPELKEAGLLCIEYSYVFEYLTKEIEPDVFSFIVQENSVSPYDDSNFFSTSNSALTQCSQESSFSSQCSETSDQQPRLITKTKAHRLEEKSMSFLNIEKKGEDPIQGPVPCKRKLGRGEVSTQGLPSKIRKTKSESHSEEVSFGSVPSNVCYQRPLSESGIGTRNEFTKESEVNIRKTHKALSKSTTMQLSPSIYIPALDFHTRTTVTDDGEVTFNPESIRKAYSNTNIVELPKTSHGSGDSFTRNKESLTSSMSGSQKQKRLIKKKISSPTAQLSLTPSLYVHGLKGPKIQSAHVNSGGSSETSKRDATHVKSDGSSETSKRDKTHVKSDGSSETSKRDKTHVKSGGSSETSKRDKTHVKSDGSSETSKRDKTHVKSGGSSETSKRDKTHVKSDGSSETSKRDKTHVKSGGSSETSKRDKTHVKSDGSSETSKRDKTHVKSGGSSETSKRDKTRVKSGGSSETSKRDKTHVKSDGSSETSKRDKTHVKSGGSSETSKRDKTRVKSDGSSETSKRDKTHVKSDGSSETSKRDKTHVKSDGSSETSKRDKTHVKSDGSSETSKRDKTHVKSDGSSETSKRDKTRVKSDGSSETSKRDKTHVKSDGSSETSKRDKTHVKSDGSSETSKMDTTPKASTPSAETVPKQNGKPKCRVQSSLSEFSFTISPVTKEAGRAETATKLCIKGPIIEKPVLTVVKLEIPSPSLITASDEPIVISDDEEVETSHINSHLKSDSRSLLAPSGNEKLKNYSEDQPVVINENVFSSEQSHFNKRLEGLGGTDTDSASQETVTVTESTDATSLLFAESRRDDSKHTGSSAIGEVNKKTVPGHEGSFDLPSLTFSEPQENSPPCVPDHAENKRPNPEPALLGQKDLESDLIGNEESELDLLGNEESESDLSGNEESESDLLGNEESELDLLGNEESESDLLGNEESESDLIGNEESESDLIGNEESESDLLGNEESELDLLGSEDESDLLGIEDESDLLGNERANEDRESDLLGNERANEDRESDLLGNERANEDRESDLLGNERANEDRESDLLGNERANEDRESDLLGNERANEDRESDLLGNERANEDRESDLLGNERANEDRESDLLGNERANEDRESDLLGNERANEDRESDLLGNERANEDRESDLLGNKRANKDRESDLLGNKRANKDRESDLLGNERANKDRESDLLGNKRANKDRESDLLGNKRTNKDRESDLLGNKRANKDRESDLLGNKRANEDSVILNTQHLPLQRKAYLNLHENFVHFLSYPSTCKSLISSWNMCESVSTLQEQVVEAAIEMEQIELALTLCRPCSDQSPKAGLIKQVVKLARSNERHISSKASIHLKTWLDFHPPVSKEMVDIYLNGLSLNGDNCLLFDLVQECMQEESESALDLIEAMIHAFELNQQATVAKGDSFQICNMIVKAIWEHRHYVSYSSKVNQLVCWLEHVLATPEVNVRALRAVCSLMNLVCQCFHFLASGWCVTGPVRLRNDHVLSLARKCAHLIKHVEGTNPKNVMLFLQLLKPAWFCALVSATVLSSYNDYLLSETLDVWDLSLESIVSKYFFLLPPHHRSQQDSRQLLEMDLQTNSPRKTKINVNKRNPKGESLLHTAAINNDFVAMQEYLLVPGVQVNLKDNNGWTPLHEACNHNSYECVELLLKYVPPASTIDTIFQHNESVKADLYAKGGQDKITPLHDAVLCYRPAICKLLLKYGGKKLLEAKDVRGFTPLNYAKTEEVQNTLLSMANDLEHSLDSSFCESWGSQEQLGAVKVSVPQAFRYEHVFGSDERVELQDCSIFLSYLSVLLSSYIDWKRGTLASNSMLHSQQQDATILANLTSHFRQLKHHIKRITSKDTLKALRPEIALLHFTCLCYSEG